MFTSPETSAVSSQDLSLLRKHWVSSATCWAAKFVLQITVAQHSQHPTDAQSHAYSNCPLSDTSQCSPKLQVVHSGDLPWEQETLMATHHGYRKHHTHPSVIYACLQRSPTGSFSHCSPVGTEGAHSLPLCQGNNQLGAWVVCDGSFGISQIPEETNICEKSFGFRD